MAQLGALWRHTAIRRGVAFSLLLLGYSLAGWQVTHGGYQPISRAFVIPGPERVPVLAVTPDQTRGNDIAIIVHGYSADKESMQGISTALARAGIASYVMDLPGHGAATTALDATSQDAAVSQMVAALASVIAYARSHSPSTDPHILLIGHSIGSAVVSLYTIAHPDAIAGTVLLSPIRDDLFQRAPQAHNVLIIAEGIDPFGGVTANARQLIADACPGIVAPNATAAACQSGAGSRAFIIAGGTTHISIFSDTAVINRIVAWAAPAQRADSQIAFAETNNGRLLIIVLGVTFAIAAVVPLCGWLISGMHLAQGDAPRTASAPASRARLGQLGVGLIAALVVVTLCAHIGAAGLLNPVTPLWFIEMPLGGFLASFFGLAGLIVFGMLTRCRTAWASTWVAPWRQVAVALIAFTFVYLTVAPLVGTVWVHLLLTGDRAWRWLILAVAIAPLMLICEWVADAASQRGFWPGLWTRSLGVVLLGVVLLGGILLNNSRVGFLSLIFPVIVLFLLLLSGLAALVARPGRTVALANSLFGALLFAWPMAALFPILRA